MPCCLQAQVVIATKVGYIAATLRQCSWTVPTRRPDCARILISWLSSDTALPRSLPTHKCQQVTNAVLMQPPHCKLRFCQSISSLCKHTAELLTRSPRVARIADRTRCHLTSRSSKVDDFHVIWQGVCYFLLVINSNLGPLSPFPRYGEKRTSFLPPPFNPKFENVLSALDRWNSACLRKRHMANYSCKDFPYDLLLSHNTSVMDDDDDEQMTDDNSTISATVT